MATSHRQQQDGQHRAYLVRGACLKWLAKRADTGEIICEQDEKSDAKTEAENRGYRIH